MKHSLFLKKTIIFTKRLLWVSSLVFVTVWLLQTRSSVQSIKNVDRYFAALQQNDVVYATTLLETYPMEEEYLQKCLYNLNEEESMFPQTLQCGLNSALAITNSNAESRVLDFLERGAVPNEETLEVALSKDYPRVALFCLKHGVKGMGALSGQPPINQVCRRLINYEYVKSAYSEYDQSLWKEIFNTLLKNNVDVNSIDYSGKTPLWYFTESYTHSKMRKEVVESLLSHGANVNKKVNGKYLIQVAIENSYVESTKLLLDAGAKPNFYITLWQPEGHEEARYSLNRKVTILEKVRERYGYSVGNEKTDTKQILDLLKRYGAKDKL
jgi:ankyrin repeat protein